MKNRILIGLMFILGIFPLRAELAGPGLTYHVDWPAIHLEGNFTLDVSSAFGDYFSTSAQGTYGGLSGQFDTIWTSVQLSAQPTRVDLTFIWDQGYTGFATIPVQGHPGQRHRTHGVN